MSEEERDALAEKIAEAWKMAEVEDLWPWLRRKRSQLAADVLLAELSQLRSESLTKSTLALALEALKSKPTKYQKDVWAIEELERALTEGT